MIFPQGIPAYCSRVFDVYSEWVSAELAELYIQRFSASENSFSFHIHQISGKFLQWKPPHSIPPSTATMCEDCEESEQQIDSGRVIKQSRMSNSATKGKPEEKAKSKDLKLTQQV